MFDVFKNRLELTGQLTTVTALRISQGRSMEPIGSDLPVVKDALGRPLIPGSSFKGAMRSRLESFLRGILGSDRKLVANPAIEEEWSLTSDEISSIKDLNLTQLINLYGVRELDKEDYRNIPFHELAKRVKQENFLTPDEQEELKKKYSLRDSALSAVVEQQTDLISRLFGSPWLSSKFQVQDLNVVEASWFDQYQERDGVAIDRDTETAADGKLYDFQVVPAGTPFHFRAIVENAENWELGLLMIGLHQFETEQIPLGGGRSRGLGVVRLENLDMTWFDARKTDNPSQTNPDKLIKYLKQITGLEIEETVFVDVSQQQRHDWVRQLISDLNQLTTSNAQQNITAPLSNEN